MQPPTMESLAWTQTAAAHGLMQGAMIGLFIFVLLAVLATLVTFGIEVVDDRVKRYRERKG